jgi:hypothetical protein
MAAECPLRTSVQAGFAAKQVGSRRLRIKEEEKKNKKKKKRKEKKKHKKVAMSATMGTTTRTL